MTDTVKLDPAAIDSYRLAATETAGHCETAAANALAAAGAPLTDLGLLGAEFAQAWVTMMTSHAADVSAIGQLVGTYGEVVTTHGAALMGADEHNAANLRAAAENI